MRGLESPLVMRLVVVVDRRRLVGSFLGGAVERIPAQNPPPKTSHAQARDKQCDAHGEPGWNPFPGEVKHEPIIADPRNPGRKGR